MSTSKSSRQDVLRLYTSNVKYKDIRRKTGRSYPTIKRWAVEAGLLHTRSHGRGLFRNLTGKSFGHLTVLNRTANSGKKSRWLCSCDCGNSHVVVKGVHLIGGVRTSCGCRNYGLVRRGRKFGGLMTIEEARPVNGRQQARCVCLCGNRVAVWVSDLHRDDQKDCGCGTLIIRKQSAVLPHHCKEAIRLYIERRLGVSEIARRLRYTQPQIRRAITEAGHTIRDPRRRPDQV